MKMKEFGPPGGGARVPPWGQHENNENNIQNKNK